MLGVSVDAVFEQGLQILKAARAEPERTAVEMGPSGRNRDGEGLRDSVGVFAGDVELLHRGDGEGGTIAILEDRYGRERQLVVDTRIIGGDRGGKEAVADDFVGTDLKRDKCAREGGQGRA